MRVISVQKLLAHHPSLKSALSRLTATHFHSLLYAYRPEPEDSYCCFENRLSRNSSLNEMKMFTIPRPLTAPRTYELSHKSRVIGIQLEKKLLSQYSDQGNTSSTTPTSRQNTMNSSADALWYQR